MNCVGEVITGSTTGESGLCRVVVVLEDCLNARDEGFANVAWGLAESVDNAGGSYAVVPTVRWGTDGLVGIVKRAVTGIMEVHRKGQRTDAQHLLYVPYASLTLGSMARLVMFSLFASFRHSTLFALQKRPIGRFAQKLLKLGRVLVLTLDPTFTEELEKLNIRAETVRPVIEAGRFEPRKPGEQDEAKRQLGLILDDRFVVIHVGHLKRTRGLDVLKDLSAQDDIQVVMVASTSTEADEGLAAELEEAQVAVIHERLSDIREAYCAADAYIFPTTDVSAAIGTPLSVLEAMLVGLPVVSTPFGGLPSFFPEGDGITYAKDSRNIVLKVRALKSRRLVLNRCSTAAASWDKIMSDSLGLR